VVNDDPTKRQQFIDIPVLAERIGVSAEHLYRLARKGDLPGCVKLGRRYVVNWPVFIAGKQK
jgi:predicted DNA-binding transcriptional regulator AlpA